MIVNLRTALLDNRTDILFIAIAIIVTFNSYYVYNNVKLANEQNDRIIQIQIAQGNLTQEQRLKLITALQDSVEILPKINNALQNVSERQVALVTLAVDDNEDTEEIKRALSIPKDLPEDTIKVTVNKSHITIDNQTTLRLPEPIS